MKVSLKQMILNHLADGAWHFGGTVEDYIRKVAGNKASNASRRLRELAEEGKLEKELVKVGSVNVVRYRLKQTEITYPQPIAQPRQLFDTKPKVPVNVDYFRG
jgi:DNA-binding HxlR family transcriptional regulator